MRASLSFIVTFLGRWTLIGFDEMSDEKKKRHKQSIEALTEEVQDYGVKGGS